MGLKRPYLANSSTTPWSRTFSAPPRNSPDEHWQQTRATFARAVEQPVDGAERLRTLAEQRTGRVAGSLLAGPGAEKPKHGS